MTQFSSTSFDEVRAAEVAFYFLQKARDAQRNITKLRFIKWLYLVERFGYARYGEPVIGDELFSMRHGPVLSKILYWIEDPVRSKPAPIWNSVVKLDHQSPRHVHVTLSENAPYKSVNDLRSLSDADIEILDDVWSEFGRLSAKALEQYLHDPSHCPEWEWVEGDGSNPIEFESLFAALGYSNEQTAELIKRLEWSRKVDELSERRV